MVLNLTAGDLDLKQVKGSMVKLVVKIIKANKSGIYDKLLSDKAKELINQRILDPVWYPFDAYKECYDALCQVEGKNDPKVIMQWGRNSAEQVYSSLYKSSITGANVKAALDGFTRFHRTAYNFGYVEGKIISDYEVQLYKDYDVEWANIFYLTIGWVQKFFELCLHTRINVKVLRKPMTGAASTLISLSWS